MNKNSIAGFFLKLRNVTCFIFTWISILVIVGSMCLDIKSVSVGMLVKILIFSLATAALLVTAFSEHVLHKKSFIFRLTLFFICFVPVEILFFYWTAFFEGSGNIKLWGSFALILLIFYLASVVIDRTIYVPKAIEYNRKLENYKRL